MTLAAPRHRIAPRAILALSVSLWLAGCSTVGATSPAPTTGGPVAGPAAACPTSQPPALAAGELRTITIQTDKGAFTIGIEADLSPIAAANFVTLAGCGFYDGLVFHRVATLEDGTPFVIQGGDPTLSGRADLGYTIQDEPVTATYQRGTVAMARSSQPNSVSSQFFVVLDDKDRDVLAYYNTYQIIGTVTTGMESVDAIYAAAGGQEQPANPIAMTKVTVSNP